MKIFLLVMIGAALTGCASAGQQAGAAMASLGVQENENAAVCIRARVESPNPFVSAVVEAKIVEIPGSVDAGTLTPDLLRAIESTICP